MLDPEFTRVLASLASFPTSRSSGDNMSSFNFLDDEVSEAICELVHQKNGWVQLKSAEPVDDGTR